MKFAHSMDDILNMMPKNSKLYNKIKNNCPTDYPTNPTDHSTNTTIDQNLTNEFISACDWGNYNKVVQLWNKSKKLNKKIDLHFEYDRALRHACYYGYLRIAKFLYKIAKENNENYDIRTSNDYCFQHACLNKHYHVAKWLTTLCPYYKIEFNWSIDDN